MRNQNISSISMLIICMMCWVSAIAHGWFCYRRLTFSWTYYFKCIWRQWHFLHIRSVSRITSRLPQCRLFTLLGKSKTCNDMLWPYCQQLGLKEPSIAKFAPTFNLHNNRPIWNSTWILVSNWRRSIASWPSSNFPSGGGGYFLIRYVRPQRVWFFGCFGHK